MAPPGRGLGALLGAAAGGLTVGASLLLRAVTGLPSLSEVLGNGLALFLPGSVFGTLIDALQERARPLLLLLTSLLVVLVGALLGQYLAKRSWRRTASRPAAPATRRGSALTRWLVPALLLWLLTLPLVALGEGSVMVSATWSELLDWLLLCGVLELLLGVPLRGGARPGRTLPTEAAMPRRAFLAYAGGVAGALALGYLASEVLSAGPPPIGRIGGAGSGLGSGELPSPITPTGDFYVVSKDLFGPPSVDAASWRLEVEGTTPYRLSYGQLLSEPRRFQTQTLECISNPVGGTLISTGIFEGTPLGRLIERAGVPRGTRQIRFSSADGYTESLPLAQALAPTTLLVHHLNGRPLTAQHGFPARILVVDHYGMKNPKWLLSVAPSAEPYLGYWEQQGWNAGAYPRIFSRFDFPSGNASLSAGRRYLLSGIAFAGTRGISAVELSFDGSRSWRRANLRPPASPYSWTIWTLPWAPAQGLYTLSVRARDGRGRYQSPGSGATFPSGAVGLQQIAVLVR